MNSGHDVDIPFNGSLREEQIPIVNLYLKSCNDIGGGIISFQKCGGGKTVLALNIISQLKKKTINVVHRIF